MPTEYTPDPLGDTIQGEATGVGHNDASRSGATFLHKGPSSSPQRVVRTTETATADRYFGRIDTSKIRTPTKDQQRALQLVKWDHFRPYVITFAALSILATTALMLFAEWSIWGALIVGALVFFAGCSYFDYVKYIGSDRKNELFDAVDNSNDAELKEMLQDSERHNGIAAVSSIVLAIVTVATLVLVAGVGFWWALLAVPAVFFAAAVLFAYIEYI